MPGALPFSNSLIQGADACPDALACQALNQFLLSRDPQITKIIILSGHFPVSSSQELIDELNARPAAASCSSPLVCQHPLCGKWWSGWGREKPSLPRLMHNVEHVA